MEATFIVPVLLLGALIVYKVWGVIIASKKELQDKEW